MSKGKGSSKQSRLSRYARAPIRILSRARDFYVHSLTSCAGNVRYAGYNDTIALPTTTSMPNLPRSFSASSSIRSSSTDEDFRELMRVASLRSLQDKFGTPEASPQQQMGIAAKGMGMMPRSVSHSVAIPRIDEDEPCDFSQDTNNLSTTNFSYPRSRSCAAVTKRPGRLSRV